MENAELLKKVFAELGITEEQFIQAFVKVMDDLVNNELDAIVTTYEYLPESNSEMSEAFRFWKQNVA